MISVANRMHVTPEYHGASEARLRDRAGLVDGMPGLVANHMLRPTRDGDPLVVLTFRASREAREAFVAWTTSDAFRQGHARSGTLLKGTFSGPNDLEIHEVVAR